MSDGASYSLEVPAAAEMATTVRVFAAGAGRIFGLEDDRIEDIRLLVNELLANAIETGGRQLLLTISQDAGGWRIRAEGAGSLIAATSEHPVDRRALVGSFASVEEAADRLELTSLSTDGDQ